MMRHAFAGLLGMAAGSLLTLLATEPGRLQAIIAAQAAGPVESRSGLELFRDVFEQVRASYVEPPDDRKLVEWAINGMIGALDRHSGYLDEPGFRSAEEEARGEFGGLGITVAPQDGQVRVVATPPGSNAARAGVRRGDIVTHLDGRSVLELTIPQLVATMRGPVGSRVQLRLRRGGIAPPIDLSIARELIRVRTVQARREGDVGYIRIAKFNGLTFAQLQAAIGSLSASGGAPKGYVLDLRNNPGGLVDQAVLVAGAFLAAGDVVWTQGRKPEDIRHYAVPALARDLAGGRPIVVLVNGRSASAAEIVAGALQDKKRATLVGTRTFGKGSVQTISSLGPGRGALKLTTAWYFLPGGRSIEATGIAPDIEVLQDQPKDPGLASDNDATFQRQRPLSADDEGAGSQAYVPPDRKDDKALDAAVALIRAAAAKAPRPINPATAD